MAGSPLKRLAREAKARELLAAAADGVVLTDDERALVERFSTPVATPGGQSRSNRPRGVNVAGHRPAPTPPGRPEVVRFGRPTMLLPAGLEPLDLGVVCAKAPRDLTFREFRLRYFGMETFPHQLRMIEAIEGARRMEITMILVFPNSGKTTLIEDYICFRVGHDPNIRIQVVSEAELHAQKMLSRVKKRMTDPDFAEFQADFGPFHAEGSRQPWAANVMSVDGATHDERDFTLQCRGWSSAVAGTRTDLLIFDDVQSTENLVETPRMVHKFRQDFLSRPGRQTKLIVDGTRVDENDFYAAIGPDGANIVQQIVQLPATRAGMVVACDLDPAEGVCNVPDTSHEESLCPELWPSHDLAFQRHQVGEPAWWRNYQQEPKRAGDGTFTQDMWDRCCDLDRSVVPLEGMPLCPVLFGVDVGVKSGHTSVIAAMVHPNQLVLLDSVDVTGFSRLEQVAETVREMAVSYRPSLVVVESDGMQGALLQLDRMIEVQQQFGFSLYPARTSGALFDPLVGFLQMASPFNQGAIRIPAGDQFSRDRFELLRDQLMGWRHNVGKNYRRDAAMALWFVWRYWAESRHVWQSRTSDWSYRAMPAGMQPVSRREALRR